MCFSLGYRKIRSSAVFGARRKNVLHVDSGIGSFFKLLEVGFSPYLSFYSHLNVLLMFQLNEAVRVRLIGPKTWDRIDRIFERENGAAVTAPRMLGAVWE